MSESRRTLSDQLDKAFDIEFSAISIESSLEFPEEPPVKREERIVDTTEVDLPQDDITYAKKNLVHLIGKGMSAFEDMADIARSTEKFAAFETLNSMMKNLANLNEQYLRLEYKHIPTESTNAQQGSMNNTNIFVGNAMDVIKLLSTANADAIEGECEE